MAAILYYWECIIMSELPADFIGLQNKIDGLVKNYLDSHPDFIGMAMAKDPALNGKTKDEVKKELASYPGAIAIAVHEEAHKLYNSGESLKRIQARQLSESAHSRTGIDIHPGTKIGDNFFVDHGTGGVIGETAKIGKNTLMYHNVTLGAYGNPKDISHRHPEIGDYCTISTGVDVLGHVKIGNNVKLNPHVKLQGNNITVGNKVAIGSSAQIADNNEIADGIIIGTAAVIHKGVGRIEQNIPAYSHVLKENGELKIIRIEDMANRKDVETLADRFKKLTDRVLGNGRNHSNLRNLGHEEQSRHSASL